MERDIGTRTEQTDSREGMRTVNEQGTRAGNDTKAGIRTGTNTRV